MVALVSLLTACGEVEVKKAVETEVLESSISTLQSENVSLSNEKYIEDVVDPFSTLTKLTSEEVISEDSILVNTEHISGLERSILQSSLLDYPITWYEDEINVIFIDLNNSGIPELLTYSNIEPKSYRIYSVEGREEEFLGEIPYFDDNSFKLVLDNKENKRIWLNYTDNTLYSIDCINGKFNYNLIYDFEYTDNQVYNAGTLITTPDYNTIITEAENRYISLDNELPFIKSKSIKDDMNITEAISILLNAYYS